VPYDLIFYKWNRIGKKSWHSVEKFLPKLLFYTVFMRLNQLSSHFFCFLVVLLPLTLNFLRIFLKYILFFLFLFFLQLLSVFLLLFDNLLNFVLNLLLSLHLTHIILRLFLFLNNIIQKCSSPVNLFNIIIINVELGKQNLILFA